MTYSKWFFSLICCTLLILASPASGQYYSSIDGGEVVPVGKIDISFVNNSVYTSENSSINTISRTYGARFGVGVFKNFDVKLQFDFLDLASENGKAMYLIPKYAVGHTGFAISLPLMAIDSEGSDENFGFSPTIAYSRLVSKKGVEIGLNASRTEFVNSSVGWYTFGVAPAYVQEKYVVRVEYGVSITDDPLPTAFHYGLALTYRIP